MDRSDELLRLLQHIYIERKSIVDPRKLPQLLIDGLDNRRQKALKKSIALADLGEGCHLDGQIQVQRIAENADDWRALEKVQRIDLFFEARSMMSHVVRKSGKFSGLRNPQST